MASVQDIFQATAAGVAAGAQLATAGSTVASTIASKLRDSGVSLPQFDPSAYIPSAVKDFPTKFANIQGKITENISPVVKELEARNIHSYNKMMFPSDIGNHFISFTFMEYSRPYPQEKPKYNVSETIFLPFPLGLAESFGAGYQDIELGLVVGATTDKLQAIASGQSGIDSSRSLASSTQAATQFALNDINSTVGAAYGMATGSVANPYLSLAFGGVPLREHNFSWAFSPNSAAESVTLHNILQTLKKRMLPQKSDDRVLLKYPHMCQIILGSDNKYLPKYKKAVLTGMTVNYAPTGIPSFFDTTGAPATYQISLNFKEIEIVTSEDIESSEKKLGTNQEA